MLNSCPVFPLADNLNTRHRNAQQAGRASIELYTLIYFYGKEVTADARVLQVRARFVLKCNHVSSGRVQGAWWFLCLCMLRQQCLCAGICVRTTSLQRAWLILAPAQDTLDDARGL